MLHEQDRYSSGISWSSKKTNSLAIKSSSNIQNKTPTAKLLFFSVRREERVAFVLQLYGFGGKRTEGVESEDAFSKDIEAVATRVLLVSFSSDREDDVE